MKSYLFDVMLTAALRIEAETEQEAREALTKILDCCMINVGAYDKTGDPVIGEASAQGDLTLAEVTEV